MKLPHKEWIIGFIEGEGNFHISLSNFKGKSNYPFDFYPILQFRIFLREDDLLVLEAIKSKIGVGKIYKKSHAYLRKKGINARDQCVYYITSLKDILKLEEFLKGNTFHSKKKEDMKKFFTIARLKASKKHLTREGYNKILGLANSMNSQNRDNFKLK